MANEKSLRRFTDMVRVNHTVRAKQIKSPILMARQTNVLLVDEDLPVRQALGRALTVENFHVVSAASGSEAVRRFGEQSIDVLLLDLNPQSESGWDTLRRLTALQPLLPVIIITARAGQQTAGNKVRTVDAWMEKPLDIPVLISVLNELASQTPDVRYRLVSRRTANGDKQ